MNEPTVERRLTPALSPECYKRLLDFYHRHPPVEDILTQTWRPIHNSVHLPLRMALDAKDPAQLANVLGHSYRNRLMYGLDSSYEHLDCFDLGSGSPEHLKEEYFLAAFLRLLRLVASNCGVPAPNPEQGTVAFSPEELVEAIESVVGCRLDYPGAGGVSGVVINGRYLPHKLIDAAGVVATMKRLPVWPPKHFVEVGAGAQWVEYLLSRLGIEYEVVDLPIVRVIGSYMMMAATGDANLLTATNSPVDLVLNQNSFPEIGDDQQDRYVRSWEQWMTPGGIFLSINHESDVNRQRRTYAVLSKSDCFTLVHRAPWWNRQGWIEEVWQRK